MLAQSLTATSTAAATWLMVRAGSDARAEHPQADALAILRQPQGQRLSLHEAEQTQRCACYCW